ncbi:MAG: VWA domain-containing protein [Proteobacteria bacterium]|nr:VWA domain-containing protein [Pseudomonadota bacterium]
MVFFRIPVMIALLASAASFGCHRLRLELADASVEKPSNVVVYFTVDTVEDEPVSGMTADQFNIYEDGRLISVFESQQTILNPEVATVRYTLLLLDMSRSVTESGQVPLIQEAVSAFIQGVGEQEKVAIYAFDGRAEIQPIAQFGAGPDQLSGRNERLSSWNTKDPSTNLNGAIVEAVQVLGEARETSDVPLRFGTLVVFTDGTDRAHRATSREAIDAVVNADVGIYVIGIGGEVDQVEMEHLGRDGFVHVGNRDEVVQAFEQVGEKIQRLGSRFYLLSYCSPSRAGQHQLEVEAVLGEEKGRLSYGFDAEGFKPDCDPNRQPSFDVPGARKAMRAAKKKRVESAPTKPKAEKKTRPVTIPPPPSY